MTTSAPKERQASSISFASVAITQRAGSLARRTRSPTCSTRYLPVSRRRAFRGRRVEASRAGTMTRARIGRRSYRVSADVTRPVIVDSSAGDKEGQQLEHLGRRHAFQLAVVLDDEVDV